MVMPVVIVLGSCIIDIAVYTHRFPLPGETLGASQITTDVGGKASNQAIALRRLGASPYLIVKMGRDDWAKHAMALWQREHIHTEYVAAHPTLATAIGVVTVIDGGENWNISALNAAEHLSVDDIKAATPVFEQATVLSLHLNAPMDTNLAALQLAQHYGVLTVVNASPYEPLPDEFFALVDVLVVNRVEAFQYTGIEIVNDETAMQAVEMLLKRGVQHVVLSLGKDGLILHSPDQQHKLESFPVKAIDTVGAGDALIAGLTVILAEGKDLLSAAKFANAVGAYAVTQRGTWNAMPTRQQVEKLIYDFESSNG